MNPLSSLEKVDYIKILYQLLSCSNTNVTSLYDLKVFILYIKTISASYNDKVMFYEEIQKI